MKPVFISLVATTALTYLPVVILHLCFWTVDLPLFRAGLLLQALSAISLLLHLAGSGCLVALTILDDVHYKALHYMLLTTALPAHFFSAVVMCVHDLLKLRRYNRRRRELLEDEEKLVEKAGQPASTEGRVLWLRAALLGLEFTLLTLFSAFCWADVLYDAAGVIEWCVAGVFGFYIGTFALDL